MLSLKSQLVNWFHMSKITQSMPPKARVRKPKPKSALKKRGRPLDAHQTNMKAAWRLWSSRRYEKNRAAWNAYTVKNRATTGRCGLYMLDVPDLDVADFFRDVADSEKWTFRTGFFGRCGLFW